MAQIQEEEIQFKSYDPQLMKRLLYYAKPYMGWIVLALFLLLSSTGVELVRPLLIGKAIDEFINGYDIPYTIAESAEEKGMNIKGYSLIRDPENQYPKAKKAQIAYINKSYYLIPEITWEDTKLFQITEKEKQQFEIEKEENGMRVLVEGKSFQAFPLTKEELQVLRQKDFQGLLFIGGIFLGVLLLGLVLSYFQTLILQYTGQKIIYNMRMEIFQHIQGLSLRFFDQNPVGRLVTRVTNDTETLNEMYTSVLVNLSKNIFLIFGIVIVMLRLDVKLSMLTFAVVPVVILFAIIFRRFSRRTYREVRVKLSKINAFLSEHISGMKLVQVFAKEKEKYQEFNEINKDLNKSHMKEIVIFGIFRPSMFFLHMVAICLVIGLGGNQVLQGVISIGTLFAFVQYVSTFFEPIQQLAEQFNILQAAMASSERIFMLLDEKADIENSSTAKALKNVKGKIEFKNVWFAYEEEEWVLKDVSFVIEPGETVAFVGATGAGKTSILNLISRYYDIQKGQILIDGIDIKEIKVQDLRSHIGQMLQDVFLFTGDIESNIRLREQGITEDEIKKVSKYVNANAFIEKLPDKYKETVRERGATLSAGQRQLLSFARTLAFNPSILILDEATANIDTETEKLIQDALYKLMEGRTTLVVAHRLSTIQHADKIIVLHKGKVREMGAHQKLLAQKGLYYNLYQLQYKEPISS